MFSWHPALGKAVSNGLPSSFALRLAWIRLFAGFNPCVPRLGPLAGDGIEDEASKRDQDRMLHPPQCTTARASLAVMGALARICFLGLIALPLFGASIWRPVRNVGIAKVSGVSGATPAVVTVDSGGLTRAGMSTGVTYNICIWGVENSDTYLSGVNCRAGVSTSDTEHRVRIAKDVNTSTNTFTVHKPCANPGVGACAGDSTEPVAGGGTYDHFGVVWRVESGPGRDLNLFFNGENVTRITSTGATGLWEATRPTVIAMKSASTSWHASARFQEPGYDAFAKQACSEALEWKAAGTTSRRDYAKWWLINEKPFPAIVRPYTGSELTNFYSGSELMDYRTMTQTPYQWCVINTMWPELSAGEKTLAADYYLNDRPGNEGGIDIDGASHTLRTVRTVSGTVTGTAGGTTVTCNSCDLSNVVAGDWARIAIDVFDPLYKIVSKSGNASFVVATPLISTFTTAGYVVAPAWTSGDMGLAFVKHYGPNSPSILCGANPFIGNAQNQCPHYAGRGGSDYSYFPPEAQASAWQNHHIASPINWMGMGFALAQQNDSRALFAASIGQMIFYHIVYPVVRSNWLGSAAGSDSYWKFRMGRDVMMACGWMKNAYTDDPEYCDDEVYRQIALLNMTVIPGNADSTTPGRYQGTGGVARVSENVPPGFAAAWAKPSLDIAGQFRYWANNTWGLMSSSIYLENTFIKEGFLQAFFGDDPAITATQRTNTTLPFTYRYLTDCLTKYTAAGCQDYPRYAMASVIGNKLGYCKGYSFKKEDHFGQQNEVECQLFANNRVLYAADAAALVTENPPTTSNIAIGGDSNWKDVYNTPGATTLRRSFGDQYLMAFSIEVANHYKAASDASAVERGMYHLKALADDVWLEVAKITTGSSKSVNWYGQFYTHTVGGGSNDTTISFDGTAKTITGTKASSSAKIATQFLGGTTTGASGTRAYKVTQAATSANTVTLARAHRITGDASAAVPALTSAACGLHECFSVGSGSSKYLVLESFGLNNLTSCAATVADADTAVACTGLVAGTYAFKINGVPVSGCEAVVVVAGEHLANCNSVGAGALTVTSGAAAAIPGSRIGGRINGRVQ